MTVPCARTHRRTAAFEDLSVRGSHDFPAAGRLCGVLGAAKLRQAGERPSSRPLPRHLSRSPIRLRLRAGRQSGCVYVCASFGGHSFCALFWASLAFLAYTSRLPKVLRALFTAAPVGYLLAHIATIFMLDAALADPAHQPGALNVLLPVDWALLLLSLAGIAYQLVRSIKDAASTFIAGGPNVEADGKSEE